MGAADLRILEVRHRFTDCVYRSAYRFGGRSVERMTMLEAVVRVRTREGQEGLGYGAMPLGQAWAFPSLRLRPEETLGLMQGLAQRLALRLPDLSGGEPLDTLELGVLLERSAIAEAAAQGLESAAVEPMPKLAVLVTASPFDAAVHDALGRATGRSSWTCYGPRFVNRDLGALLDPGFAGRYAEQYLRRVPAPRLALCHSVGALDPLGPSDLLHPLDDGLPETLGAWIARDGLTHLKIKLDGGELGRDLERFLAVDRVAEESAPRRRWQYTLDFNERCEDAAALLAFLETAAERAPAAFARIQYLEQPAPRASLGAPGNRMHAVAALKPVVIDESLVDYQSLLLAAEMGYSGVALKACKGQTQTLLMAAAALERGLFLCVQDLTCPGAAFLHSASLAAHLPGVSSLEANARQYCPQANAAWMERYPELFSVHQGTIATGRLCGPGLSGLDFPIPPEPAT